MRVKKLPGYSLIEVLLALAILGIALPALFSAFGTVFMAEIRIHEVSRKAFCAEGWFSRLELPVSAAALSAMPRADENGKTRFRWETEKDACGAILVTLSVSNGALGDIPFVTSRAFP